MILLVCDDNKKELEKIKNIVNEINYIDHIYACKNGQEMIDIAKNNPVDLIITDIDMPNVNGIDAVGKIKDNYRQNVRVIFMTGFPEYSIKSHDYRPVDFIVKPIDTNRLLESISIAYDMIESYRLSNQARVCDTIFIYKFRKSTHMIDYDNILFFEKNGRNINIILDDDSSLSYYEDFTKLQERLPLLFFKSSSKHIINLKKVYKISPLSRTTMNISFKNSNLKAVLNKSVEGDFLYRYHRAKY